MEAPASQQPQQQQQQEGQDEDGGHYDYTRDQLPNQLRANGDLGTVTTAAGWPLYEHHASLTLGRHGPVALEDHHLLETLAHFARERIPERVVHAKGASAAGEFTCTAALAHLTTVAVFAHAGKRTPVRARFSTVAGSLGSADTVRDPRGFAVKFYTEAGVWDLVGNNTPIFFVRDPIMFPMFIHSQKRNPATNVQDMNAFWDFISLRPETTHQVLILMSDRGIPDGHRHMHGYGSHTYALLSAAGAKTYCKFHWRTQQGVRNLQPARAQRLAGAAPDYAQKDLYNAIARGAFPRWTLHVQTMSEAQAAEAPFDAFDVTKVWPQRDYPLLQVGELVLNRNPQNHFAEVEQLAFSPAHFVPGIGPSQDRMLLGRIFSYGDAHRHRLGANFAQLPVNAPFRAQHYQRDGAAAVDNQAGAPNYSPNSFGGPRADAELRRSYPTVKAAGTLARYDTTADDDFAQPRVFYRRVLREPERQRLADNIVAGLQRAVKLVQERTVALFANVDEDLAKKITAGLKAATLSVAL